jgi:hypothetical protein
MHIKTLPKFWFEPRPWIDGKWQTSGETFDVRNPATVKLPAAVQQNLLAHCGSKLR